MNAARLLTDENTPLMLTGAALYQMAPCANRQMMGYVLRTAGGKLFLIDGGTEREAEAFLNLARKAVRCQPGEVLKIDGWFLTHPHDDHINAFMEIIRSHADCVKIEHLWYNFPSPEYHETYENWFSHTSWEFRELLPKITPFAEIVHAGDSFVYDDIRFDILTEPDESILVNVGNNSSVAVRVTVEGQVLLFLGDMGAEEGRVCLETYGEEGLRADIVELAHHGQNGVEPAFYFAVKPRACLWCTPGWLWKNDSGKGYGTGPFQTFLTRCLMQDLGVQHHFIEKDGIWEIPLPYPLEPESGR